jgi:hypothetical protein
MYGRKGAELYLCLLYGCGALSFTLWEEHRLRVFENRVLRRIVEPMTNRVTAEWRRLCNYELNALYSSPNIFSGDEIEKNVLGRSYGTYTGEERYI